MTGIFTSQSSTSQASLLTYRQQFPGLANKAYFNYGGQGPLPEVALEAIQQSYVQIQQLGPFSNQSNTWIVNEAELTRRAIAAELGTTSQTITLTENVSAGCNIALWGINWRSGDHLLLSDCEHPGIIAAVQELQRRFGIEVSICPFQETLNVGDPVAVLEQHLRPTTRLVVLSHILWNTGQVLPLAAITAVCHRYPSHQPIQVLVDAAQSVGVLPLQLDQLQADFYAFTGHKWWCGPEGLGGLYIRPEALANLHPTFIGWRGITADSHGQPTGWKPNGQRYELATSAYPLYAGVRAAISLHHQWGTAEARYQRLQTLSYALWQQLADLLGVVCLRSTPPEAGLVSFQLPGKSHNQLVSFLESNGFMLRVILNPDCVRACIHYLTLESEIDQLVEAIRQFMQRSGA
ncbi:aminotransferase class V-fold PLP-dependent enzyme [Phormidium sp. FACHB-592]|uniref:Aminotransferase class V-fold PLP-dependent enzyme n=1 Tax=Stenomitos frigidus AS-A4 TaxID=2933935 RepID=A0ABV0KE86_9CYAN|nr:aminotransferase class V-fold PLP-dependent enzyme [Phormidium sp. FACHB-592]MBD2075969.1 aminotransferase class V-fold PLP-dependent enzyme [Phormidium sp. FACHB-592]